MLNRYTGAIGGGTGRGKIFAEGERVFVRVLGEAGGKYAVSCGGVTFFAESAKPLREGDTFSALIKYQDGKIRLAPQPDTAPTAAHSRDGGAGEGAFPPALASYLTALGVPPDAVSLAIVRFMRQFGCKFDEAAASRARKLAAKFPGREAQAAEAALYALEKGIDADERMVEKILDAHGGAEGAFAWPQGADGSGGGGSGSAEGGDAVDDEDARGEESFLSGLFEQKTLVRAEAGFLTLCNHIVSSNLHWILLPFEQGEHTRGIIRFLCNIAQKTLEKAEIRARVVDKTLCFVIHYVKGKPSEVSAGDYARELSRELVPRGVVVKTRRGDTDADALFVDGNELIALDAEA